MGKMQGAKTQAGNIVHAAQKEQPRYVSEAEDEARMR